MGRRKKGKNCARMEKRRHQRVKKARKRERDGVAQGLPGRIGGGFSSSMLGGCWGGGGGREQNRFSWIGVGKCCGLGVWGSSTCLGRDFSSRFHFFKRLQRAACDRTEMFAINSR